MQAFLYLNCLCVIYFQIYIFFLSPVFYVLDPENDKGHVQADVGSLSVQFCVYIKSYFKYMFLCVGRECILSVSMFPVNSNRICGERFF